MTTLFISDLHLDSDRRDIGNHFLDFLKHEAREAEALYILGDLFEAWVGDDDPNAHYAVIKLALRNLFDHGVPVYFMRGNRDFLIGNQFASETGVTILPDPFRVTMYGEKALLSHGDLLCTDDLQYQKIRKMTRDPEWQTRMLAKPLRDRLKIAQQARQGNAERGIDSRTNIRDVNEAEVERTIREQEVDVLLHGHTHRPAVHNIEIGKRKAKRIVLGDWYKQGSVVRWNLGGPRLEQLPR